MSHVKISTMTLKYAEQIFQSDFPSIITPDILRKFHVTTRVNVSYQDLLKG